MSVVVVVVDQVSKFFVKKYLSYASYYPVSSNLNFYFIYNKGIAFSLFANGSKITHGLILCLAVIISCIISHLIVKNSKERLLYCTALAFILGGAVGNIIDKIMLGAVVDFIDVYSGVWHFATFNLADSAVSLGVMLLVLDYFKNKHYYVSPEKS